MTVSARKITAFAKLVAGLADTPNLGSTTLLKQWFDSSPEELRVAFNGLIDDLLSAVSGSSGAENIGSAAISGVAGATAYAQLVDLKAQLNAAVIGTIPDGTLDYVKLNAATKDKLTEYGLARQAVIDGNFDITQRGTSFTNPINNAYTLDRFSLANGMTGTPPTSIIHTQQQLVPGDISNAYYFYRINPNGAGSGFGANDVYAVIQKIENGVRYLAGLGKKVTLSFWARSSIAGKKLGIYTQQIYGTGGSPTAGESIVGTNFTLTTTWTKYTLTISTNTLVGKVFGTNNDDNFVVGFVSMWGTGVYAGLVGSTGVAETFGGSGNIDIAQVQLNAGDIALPFQPKSIGDNIKDSQRYAISLTSSDANSSIGTGYGLNTTSARIIIMLPSKMRVIPTLVATAADWQLTDGSTLYDLTAISLTGGGNSDTVVTILCTVASGLTGFRPYSLISKSVNKLMLFDAEL